ncbi:TetR/AcrR family transcriptional regulator [Nocardia sp. NPDC046473]|uniref:TetR/AcrR family transcriptional regulator n=1 Tax=Nocardia sp. NPDC046473 TaxID=3155733 RepID=UPI0033DECB74
MSAPKSSPKSNGAGAVDDDLTRRRRKEISLGACAVFDERGYANTRIADISDRLGIGQGTIYRYFTGKDDLMDHIIDHGVRRILAAMREDPAVATDAVSTGAQFADQITTVAHRLLEMAAQEQALMRVLLIHAPAARPDAIDELTDQLAAATAAYLDVGVENGYLRTGLNTMAVADALTGVTLAAIRRVLRGQLDATARESTAHAIGDFVASGAVNA